MRGEKHLNFRRHRDRCRLLQIVPLIREFHEPHVFAYKEGAAQFPLPWSHYARLLAVRSVHARAFYEYEALRGGWTIRQLDRQIQSQFYERTALSRDKVALLAESDRPRHTDSLTPDEEIKEPYVLEFLGLKDEYSESELEDALLCI